MPKIDFNFSGYIRGADIDAVHDAEGTRINVSGLSAGSLADGLNEGRYFISLQDFLYSSRKNEIVLDDFEAAQ